MVDDEIEGGVQPDLARVWNRVGGVERSLVDIARRFDDGFKTLTNTIDRNNERNDVRMSAHQESVDKRFEAIQQQTLASFAGRSSQQWQVFVFIASTIIGVGGLGATLWALTKAPIDAAFVRADTGIATNSTDIKNLTQSLPTIMEAQRKDFEAKLLAFVPKGEVDARIEPLKTGVEANTKRINELDEFAATSRTDRENMHKQLDAVIANTVPRPENENRFTDLMQRINSLFDRLNIVQAEQRQGGTTNDRLNRIQDSVENLVNRLLVLPQLTLPVSPAQPKRPSGE